MKDGDFFSTKGSPHDSGQDLPLDMYGDLLVVILFDKFPDCIYENLSHRHDSEEWALDLLDQLRTATNGLRLFEERQSLQLLQPVTGTNLFVDASSKPVKPNLCHFCAGSHASTGRLYR